MVGKLVRRLKEIDAEIRRETNKKAEIKFSIFHEEMIIGNYQKRIDQLTGPNILGYTIDNSEGLRSTINGLATSIGERYLRIWRLRKVIDICDTRIEALKMERKLVSERLDRLTYNEQLRELDIYDYQTIIEKNGFIRGIKL